ncbi:MAG: Fe-S protein assembly co-chaperone HscB [Alphaproteobacteria bacterium]
MNYFELLNITPAFDIDLGTLEKAYFTEQRKYHPDRFAIKPVAEKHAAMQRSVDINNAYNTLKDPLKRAQYLLSLNGIIVGTDKDTVKPSQHLLIEVMGWREECIAAEKLENLRKESIEMIAKHTITSAWEAIAQETLRLGYIVKTLEDAKR